MADSEMEIATDFGLSAMGGDSTFQDIDIDIDFDAGQADEDVELQDYDQVPQADYDLQGDGNDELMTEDDHASYSMVDANDMELNEPAAPTNDYDVEIGDTDDNSWQPASVDIPNGPTNEVLEPVLETAEEPLELIIEPVDANDDSWLQAETTVGVDVPVEQIASIADQTHSRDETDARAVPRAASGELINENESNQDHGLAPEQHVAVESADVDPAVAPGAEDESVQQPSEVPVSQETFLETAQGTNDHNSNERISSHISAPDTKFNTTNDANNVTESYLQFDDPDEAASQPGKLAHDDDQYEQGEEDGSNVLHEAHRINQDVSGTNEGGVEDAFVSNPPNDDRLDLEAAISGSPASDTFSEEATSGYDGPDATDREGSPAAKSTPSNPGETGTTTQSATSGHDITINYGETDYRLFAKSADDDPNQFFLEDASVLDQPLSNFISSLRAVIVDEVSPLDELAIHVDGLGLEFAETTSNDFLEENTFRNIIDLFDSLIQNEDSSTVPEFYVYLILRPNCAQRLAALVDQVNAGRGWTEVAVYRESPRQPSPVIEYFRDEDDELIEADTVTDADPAGDDDSPLGNENFQEEEGDDNGGDDNDENSSFVDENDVPDPNQVEAEKTAAPEDSQDTASHGSEHRNEYPEYEETSVHSQGGPNTNHHSSEIAHGNSPLPVCSNSTRIEDSECDHHSGTYDDTWTIDVWGVSDLQAQDDLEQNPHYPRRRYTNPYLPQDHTADEIDSLEHNQLPEPEHTEPSKLENGMSAINSTASNHARSDHASSTATLDEENDEIDYSDDEADPEDGTVDDPEPDLKSSANQDVFAEPDTSNQNSLTVEQDIHEPDNTREDPTEQDVAEYDAAEPEATELYPGEGDDPENGHGEDDTAERYVTEQNVTGHETLQYENTEDKLAAPENSPSQDAKAPEDEITWESDTEDAAPKTKAVHSSDSRQSGQVSPSTGKRTRSVSDVDESTDEQNDVKRVRS